MYQYMQAHASIYQYIPAHTGTYHYIPVHTYADLGSKKVQTGFEPEIFCIFCICFPTALWECRHHIQDTTQWKCKCTYAQFSCSCLCTWLLMMNWQRWSSSAPASSHDVHRPDLDWYLTIAQPCTATGFGLCNVVQVMSSSCSFQNVPVPVPLPGAYWWQSQFHHRWVRDQCGLASQLNLWHTNNIKILKA